MCGEYMAYGKSLYLLNLCFILYFHKKYKRKGHAFPLHGNNSLNVPVMGNDVK